MRWDEEQEKRLRQAHLYTNWDKADGTAEFVSDIRWPDLLEGLIVRAPVPRCRINKLDVTHALAMPGVHAIVTADDINGIKRIGKTLRDQDILCRTETYGIYDAIALIAAETIQQAQDAAGVIDLDYEELPAVYDLDEAMKPGAVLARPDINPNSNLLTEYHYFTGDADHALAVAPVCVEHQFEVPAIEHCYLENDCAVARFLEDGMLEVYVGCHDIVTEQQILLDVLEMPKEKVRVILPFMGGSFGGKDDGLICAYAALMARKACRPVRLWIDRSEEMAFHTKRHGQRLNIRMGFALDGTIMGAAYRIVSDTGSSAHHGENIFKFISVNACGPYRIPNVKVDTLVYYTNAMAMGAMRSWGMPGITFANETMINLAAAELGMDPLKLRRLNGVTDGDRTLSGVPVPRSARFIECLDGMEKVPLTETGVLSPRYRYGVGYAAGAQGCNLHFGHPDESTVRLRVGTGGEIYIEVAANDLGQGLETTLDLIVSRVLDNYFIKKIHYLRPISDYPVGGPTGASRQTTLTGNAAYLAAVKLKEEIKKRCGGQMPGDLAAWLMANGEGIGVVGTFMAPLTSDPDKDGQGLPVNQYAYGIQRAEVSVDMDTGIVRVLRIVEVCDCGEVINHIGAEGQVQGAIGQNLGMALMEEFQQKNGKPVQRGFSEYLFPTAVDTPPIDVMFVDQPAELGYLHVKGMAELSTTFTAPAIVAAIHDAAGVWIGTLPATPERVLAALTRKEAMKCSQS